MATPEERATLMATACSWCGAAPGEPCTVRRSRSTYHPERMGRQQRVLPVSTLDAGCHDARWRAALGRSAPVVAAAVKVAQSRGPVAPARSLASTGPIERPW